MDNLLIATFITGLTAGGLSCFAVQGGLLSGSIARQVEAAREKPAANQSQGMGNRQGIQEKISSRGMALSVALFLAAKLAAYTLLGFGLGWLGSFFYLSPTLKGTIQIIIGIFLLGNALRMFHVHPIFRYFSFEPPSFLTRYIRRISKGNDRHVTPLFLGALTVLIPCGITQSAMAVAVGTGSPLYGAAIMFMFVLGTSPTFFGVTVLATGLAKVFQKYFLPVVAVIVLALGLYTIDGGLNVIGSPLSSSAIWEALSNGQQPVAAAAAIGSTATSEPSADTKSKYPLGSTAVSRTAATTPTNSTAKTAPAAPTTPGVNSVAKPTSAAANVITINVLNSGYSPNRLTAPANQPIQLVLVTQNTQSCSRAFVIPSLNIQKMLPANGESTIEIPAQKAGTSLRFTCSMGMYTGVIQFQ